MKRFKLKLASIDMLVTDIPKDSMFLVDYNHVIESQYCKDTFNPIIEYIYVDINSPEDLEKIKNYAAEGYFGCDKGWFTDSLSLVIDYKYNEITILDFYYE